MFLGILINRQGNLQSSWETKGEHHDRADSEGDFGKQYFVLPEYRHMKPPNIVDCSSSRQSASRPVIGIMMGFLVSISLIFSLMT